MATQPILTIRNVTSPFSTISSVLFAQSTAGGNYLPVLQGQTSDPVLFRIYNNFALATGIATAINIYLTVFDGAGASSHTCALLPVSQSWVRIQEYGYGENSVTSPDNMSYYLGTDTAIGGNLPCGTDRYVPEVGSDGLTTEPKIRAYSNTNGMGYIQFKSYVQVPDASIVQNQTYNFVISVVYEWFT